MPVITNRPGIVTPPTIPATAGATPGTGAAGITATTATSAVSVGTPSRDPAVSGPMPSTSAADLKPLPVVFNGFDGKPFPRVNINLTPGAGQLGAADPKPDLEDGGWVNRGYIDVKYAPAVGGVDVTVESRHTRPSDPATYQGDDMVLYLQARVLDQGKERIITLATMFDGAFNSDGTSTGSRRFHVSYDDINAWLKAKSPNLAFRPGDPLAVHAVWKASGHQWGGFMREGYFLSPAPLGRTSPLDVRSGKIPEAPPAPASGVHKPIDITHKLPDAMVAQFPLVLESGGKLVSRREHETKFCPRALDELKGATLRLLDVAAAGPAEREKLLIDMFGKDEHLTRAVGRDVSGWKLHTTDRYYAKDAGGKVLKGADGLPIVAPMFDVYQDAKQPQGRTGSFPFARGNMAVRFRDGEIKAGSNVGSMGKLNMKTPRVADPFTLIQTGLELSLDTKPGISKNGAAMQQLSSLLDQAPAPYNPLKEQRKVNFGLSGADVQQSAVNNLANRFKFTLEHDNGMELEISMDFVHAGFVFESKEVAGTKAMSEPEKFDHYATLLAKPDDSVMCLSGPQKTSPGELNTVVFGVPKDDGTLDLTMASFWIDETGGKRCTEHPAVRFPQVEIEMDHVQARSTGPVQSAYQQPTEVKNIENDTDQDAFLQTVSDQATMNGPPTTHVWEDLKDIKLYRDNDYVALGEAVTDFRQFLFPGGVDAARQKAAQALELGGYIPKQSVTLSATMPYTAGRDVNVNVNWQKRDTLEIRAGNYTPNSPTKGTLGGQPVTLTLDWDGFPIKIPFKGTETPREVAETIQQTLDKAVHYKAELTENNGTFTVTVVERS